MKAIEAFKSKTEKNQVSKEWEAAEPGNDPLIKFWMERKKRYL